MSTALQLQIFMVQAVNY